MFDATLDDAWTMDLEVRLYRHRESQARPVEVLWQAAADVLARGAMARGLPGA